MEIHRSKVTRQITLEEAMRLKKIKPFSSYRQDAKAVNFGLIFGMSYKKFSMTELELKWPMEKVDAFIKDKKLEDNVSNMEDRHPSVSTSQRKYYAVADYIRTSFFEAYVGLQERIERNQEFAKKTGYVRSYHGGIRRLPLLTMAFDPKGKTRKDESGKEVANWNNICANSTIQTDEICCINLAINKWEETNTTDELIDVIIGTVHDSVDLYILKETALTTLARMQELFEEEEPWMKGMKFPIDMTIVDLNMEDHYYKHGWSYKEFLMLKKEGKI